MTVTLTVIQQIASLQTTYVAFPGAPETLRKLRLFRPTNPVAREGTAINVRWTIERRIGYTHFYYGLNRIVAELNSTN
ncbi:MAG: hypothetical protein U1F76_30605 [Candidatus Competibacteraceae bacterium]